MNPTPPTFLYVALGFDPDEVFTASGKSDTALLSGSPPESIYLAESLADLRLRVEGCCSDGEVPQVLVFDLSTVDGRGSLNRFLSVTARNFLRKQTAERDGD